MSYDLQARPEWVYATWIDDPTSTFAIRWNSFEGDTELRYKKEGEEGWKSVLAENETLFPDKIILHNVQLTHLEPSTTYLFQIGNDKHVYTCKTLSKELATLRFVIGGDVYRSLSLMEDMHIEVAHLNPEFVVIGGDIAYTKPHKLTVKDKKKEADRWSTFFKIWGKYMIKSDGSLIPLMATLGNHDISSGEDVYFSKFFRDEKAPSYQVLDIGEYLSLFLLDSGHRASIDGNQKIWLKENLEERTSIPNKIAVYHVSAYPSVYQYKGGTSKKIRQFWCPLFEEYGVQLAFENHNHAYKRTFRIKQEKIDPNGVLYLGDGAWGVPVRTPKKPKDLWYLEKSAAINSVFLVSLDDQGYKIDAIDIDGDVFDQVAIPTKLAQP